MVLIGIPPGGIKREMIIRALGYDTQEATFIN